MGFQGLKRFELADNAALAKIGDAITPEASVVEFPPLLDFPAPRLRAYPREATVAEKFEAMVKLQALASKIIETDPAVAGARKPIPIAFWLVFAVLLTVVLISIATGPDLSSDRLLESPSATSSGID